MGSLSSKQVWPPTVAHQAIDINRVTNRDSRKRAAEHMKYSGDLQSARGKKRTQYPFDRRINWLQQPGNVLDSVM